MLQKSQDMNTIGKNTIPFTRNLLIFTFNWRHGECYQGRNLGPWIRFTLGELRGDGWVEGWWARSSSAVAWRATGCHSGGNWSELRKDGGREEGGFWQEYVLLQDFRVEEGLWPSRVSSTFLLHFVYYITIFLLFLSYFSAWKEFNCSDQII